MNLFTKNLLVVSAVLLFVFTADADTPPQNTGGQGSISFGIYDVEKSLTPGGWLLAVGGLVLVGYGIYRFLKRPRIK